MLNNFIDFDSIRTRDCINDIFHMFLTRITGQVRLGGSPGGVRRLGSWEGGGKARTSRVNQFGQT